MLTLTDSASTVVKTIIERTPDVSDAALRISASEPGASDLSLAVATQPEPSDTVIETAGAKVFVEQNAALVLDDKVLDAKIEDDGSVRFSIEVQK
jgi:Fe-S cluster assembly iron-binding protein IscA